MKTNLKNTPIFLVVFFITVIVSIILVSCGKDDESENPYNTEKITLTDYEKSFLTLTLHDTLYYAEENILWSGEPIVDSTVFYLVSNIDTVITDSKIQYTYSLKFASISGEGSIRYKIVYTKTVNYFDMSVLIWDISFQDNPIAHTIQGLLFHKDTLRLNNYLYNDVYHIEADTTYNNSHCIHIHRAFFVPNYGLVSVTNDCNSLYFYNL